MDDPVTDWVPRAAARTVLCRAPVSNVLSRAVERKPHGWQEESDADTRRAGTRKVYT